MHDTSCHSRNLVTCLLVQSIAGIECGIGYAGVLLLGLTIEVILTLRNIKVLIGLRSSKLGRIYSQKMGRKFYLAKKPRRVRIIWQLASTIQKVQLNWLTRHQSLLESPPDRVPDIRPRLSVRTIDIL